MWRRIRRLGAFLLLVSLLLTSAVPAAAEEQRDAGETAGVEVYLSENETVCTVQVRGCELGAGEDLLAAIWSENGGKDDLAWCVLEREDQGVYRCDRSISRHRTAGTYQVHIYRRHADGQMEGLAGRAITVSGSAMAGVSIENQSGGTCRVVVEGVSSPSGVSKVQVPIWSRPDQSDLVWYTAEAAGEGTYFVDMDIRAHGSHTGTYKIDVYVTAGNGIFQCVGGSSVTFEGPSLGGAEITADGSGGFVIELTGVGGGTGISRVQVPVWSQPDQSNLVWYEAEKTGEGTYRVESDISRHNYRVETYIADLYLTDGNGVRTCAGRRQFSFQASAGAVTLTQDPEETLYPLVIRDVQVPGGEDAVLAAVWSENGGQDDLYWYTARKNGTEYEVDIDIRRHRDLGPYQIHVYARTKSGQMVILAKNTELQISGRPQADISVSAPQEALGIFEVAVGVSGAASGVSKVEVPVWSQPDQGDLRWYVASLQADGTYRVKVNVADHGYALGGYQVHAYVTGGNGTHVFAGKTEYVFDPAYFLYVTGDSGSGRRRIVLENVPEGVSQVQFPVWSEQNGQDDIVWYSASNQGGGRWEALMETKNHRDSGTYCVHAYADGTGVRGGITFQVDQTEMRQVIVLDPGHQAQGDSTGEPIGPGSSVLKARVSSGTSGSVSGLAEYELNLQVALKLRTELERRGYTVYMTRETHNINISNRERAEYAASVGGDILVRIHANGSDSSSVSGALCMAPSGSNPFVAHLAPESQRLSRCIVDSYCGATGFPNQGVYLTDEMSGINWATMPVTIVEMGYMTNPGDDARMADPDFQAVMVRGIAEGIDAYFGY